MAVDRFSTVDILEKMFVIFCEIFIGKFPFLRVNLPETLSSDEIYLIGCYELNWTKNIGDASTMH